MATAQEMADFAAHARYIHLTDAQALGDVVAWHFNLSSDQADHVHAVLQGDSHSSAARQPSLQFRDKDGRLCWIQGRIDPLGLPHLSLRYQANEWTQDLQPKVDADAQKHDWQASTVRRRHEISRQLQALSHDGGPKDTALENKIADFRGWVMRGNNAGAPTEPIEADHSVGPHPVLIGGRPYPKHPHHWTCDELRAFLVQHSYPANTIDDRVREHEGTLRKALLMGHRVPARVMASPEGRRAADAAVLAYASGQQATRLERAREERAKLTSQLLASLADTVSDTQRQVNNRPVTTALIWAALDSSAPTPQASPPTALLARGLGSSSTAVSPLIPFPLRITFVTRHMDLGETGGPNGSLRQRIPSLPPSQSCSLLVEDARLPFGNAWAQMASYSAEQVTMAVSDLLHDGVITPDQARRVIGSQWLQAARPHIAVLSSPGIETEDEVATGELADADERRHDLAPRGG